MFTEASEMNDKIIKILNEMDPYMPAGSMIDFLYGHKKLIKFNVYLSKKELGENLTVLDLSQRSINCLRRAGFNTLGDLLKAISVTGDERSKEKLLRLRNLGRKSAEEILLTIMCYQFQILSDREKADYLQDIVKLNADAA